MRRDEQLDDAIEVATERTLQAQDRVSRSVEDRDDPGAGDVSEVVHRAEDLHELTLAAEDQEAPPTQ